jgi:hypothetical protein
VGDVGVTISDHSQKVDRESKSFLQERWHIRDKEMSEEVDCVCDVKL